MLITEEETPLRILRTDGGSRGNGRRPPPRPEHEQGDGRALASGIGASITVRAQDGSEQEIWWGGKRVEDNTSNNEAEYQALILGLQSLKDKGWECEPTLVMSDSQLAVRQLTGEYETFAEHLVPLYLKCKELLSDFPKCKIVHTMREDNKRADALANWAMDNLQPDGDAVTKGMAWGGRPPPMFTSPGEVQRTMRPGRMDPDGALDRGQRMKFIRAATGAKQSTVVDSRQHIRRGGARRLKYLDEKEAELERELRDHVGNIMILSQFVFSQYFQPLEKPEPPSGKRAQAKPGPGITYKRTRRTLDP